MSFFSLIIRIVLCLMGLILITYALSVHAGAPKPIQGHDFDPDLGALVHKEKARQHIHNKDRDLKNDDPANPCGTISINSNNQPQRNSTTRPGKQNVTVVTGPVLNVANCK